MTEVYDGTSHTRLCFISFWSNFGVDIICYTDLEQNFAIFNDLRPDINGQQSQSLLQISDNLWTHCYFSVQVWGTRWISDQRWIEAGLPPVYLFTTFPKSLLSVWLAVRLSLNSWTTCTAQLSCSDLALLPQFLTVSTDIWTENNLLLPSESSLSCSAMAGFF